MANVSPEDIKRFVEDMGGEIGSGEDALHVIGRSDALASAIFQYSFPKKKISKAMALPQVLRMAAKAQATSAQARLLRRAARRAATLLAIADEVSYGELHDDGVGRAEDARGELYDMLYEWLESLEDDDE